MNGDNVCLLIIIYRVTYKLLLLLVLLAHCVHYKSYFQLLDL